MEELKKIIEKYDFINATFPDKKYLHLNSIRNFIIHFENFASYTEKIFVIELINKYFDFISDKEFLILSDGKQIFYEYIQPLGTFYSKRLGFTLYTSFYTYLIWILFSLMTFYLLNISILFYVITILFLCAIYIPKYLKLKRNHVYGFNF